MNWYEIVRLIGVVLGGVGSYTFVLYYGFTSPWWTRETGRWLMLSGTGWASLYTAGIIGAFTPPEIVTNIIRMVLIVLAATIVWRQVFLYHKMRNKEAKDD